jgi:CPA1 family monovalent cation:H+ antiporter
MEIYNALTVIIVLTAIFAYINFRFIKLPGIIGIMIISLIASLLIIITGKIIPFFYQNVVQLIGVIDFHTVLLKIMLSFLLFAGAFNINAAKLKKEIAPVITFSTIGVLLSAFIVAALLFITAKFMGLQIDFIYCLLFGALISPTDPIAVLGILKQAKIPSSLEIKISGESLFNDGVGVVIFITLLEIAATGLQNISAVKILWLFVKEAGGGIGLGFLLGYIGFWAMRSINNYKVEVLITLAIVMGGYLLADVIHVSGPLAMVVAGIVTGNKSRHEAMSDTSRNYIESFWEMIDEIMNAVLFLLIGFQMLIIPFNSTVLFLGCIAIMITLFARFISIALPIYALEYKMPFEKNAIPILTWGGLRGGLSVAMALSIPEQMFGNTFVSITYIIVLFSIVVQGLTIGKIAKRLAVEKR